MGIKIDFQLAYVHIAEICERAKKYSNFVRIDMEDSSLTEATLELYKELRKKYDNVGVVLQAYLKRTLNDIITLRPLNPNFRLCKGIYIEPESIAYQSKKKVRRNFIEALETMFKNGMYVGIATHDEYLIKEAYRLIEELKISKDKYEFQMLYGVKEKLRDKINSDGHRIRIYCPFGEKWHKYSMRRLQENPNIAWHITKSIFFPN
jgi:proline dehydrogenase